MCSVWPAMWRFREKKGCVFCCTFFLFVHFVCWWVSKSICILLTTRVSNMFIYVLQSVNILSRRFTPSLEGIYLFVVFFFLARACLLSGRSREANNEQVNSDADIQWNTNNKEFFFDIVYMRCFCAIYLFLFVEFSKIENEQKNQFFVRWPLRELDFFWSETCEHARKFKLRIACRARPFTLV